MEKMSKALLTSKTAWSSRLCALTWKDKVTKAGRSIFQLQVSALPTEEKESGLLPTPTTQEIEHPNMKLTKTGRRLAKDGKNSHSLNLADTVKMWATPNTMDYLPPRSKEGTMKLMQGHRKGRTRPANLREQVDPETMKMWRTPDAHCDRGASSEKRMKMKLEKKMPISINDQVAHPNLMWPTPTQDSATERTKKYSQGDKPLTLAVKESLKKMVPTPTARD